MSRFASNKVEKIDLGNDEWVEVKTQLSFEEMVPIVSQLDQSSDLANVKMAMPLLELAITGWNLEDETGEPVEFNTVKVKELDMDTVMHLVGKCTELYFSEKKNLEPSGE